MCAETADQLNEQVKRAENLADVIEIRFDCLNDEEVQKAVSNLPEIEKFYLATFRPLEQGGKRDLTLGKRLKFWESFLWHNKGKKLLIDFELNFELSLDFEKIATIVSFHDFADTSENLAAAYDLIVQLSSNSKNSIIKIAAKTGDIADTIQVWKLLEKAESDNQRIVPIAMGEAGKWTRILGLANGAFMTYAALDAGRETAPGQISARDLTEVYRVKELNERTEIYGIIAGDTSYTMSPYMHNAAFRFHNLDAVFVPLQMQNLDEFMRRMVKPKTREIALNFKGFAVTMPHKQNIIKHLDFLDEAAEKIGAVNTVKIEDGKFYGHNTDAQGFIEPLLNSYGDLEGAKVAICGAGGAARACLYALKKAGANATIFARDLKKAESLADEFHIETKELPNAKNRTLKTDFNDFDILVNSTPLGRKGAFENETPFTADQIENVKIFYDLNYNPFQTLPMTEADKAGVPKISGLAMLVAQAMAQQKIWTGKTAPLKEMSRAVLKKLQ